jgi:tetratricopeptide (TPR) repeat protein
MPEEFDVDVARAEVERLREKQSQLKDQDIILALQDRIDSLESEIMRRQKASLEPVPVAEPAPVPTPATPDQLRKADNLIRESRVEKMRGNKAKALSLLQEAAAAAPSSPTVLEALGDDLNERKQYKSALEVYQNALTLAKGNIGIEKKVALTSLKASGMGSIDAQLRAGLSDSLFALDPEQSASLGVARVLTAVMPGAGHILLRRTTQGILVLVLWLACVGSIVVMKQDFSELFQMMFGKHVHPNLVVLAPMFGAIVIYLGALASLGGGGKGGGGPKPPPIDRPTPPVNLPFE